MLTTHAITEPQTLQPPSAGARYASALTERPPCAYNLTQSFFLPTRLAIASRELRKEYHNIYIDALDYHRRAGSKLKGLVNLCIHGFKHDDIDMPVYSHDTHPVFPEPPNTPNPGIRKIVVMHEFPMMAALIESVSF